MPLTGPTRKPLPSTVAGQYVLTSSPGTASAVATLGIGTLRLVPWLVESTLKIDRLGSDISVVGDVGSKLRIGIYGDNGACYPGALVLDAGTIAGDSATVQDITLGSTLVLPPALYWIGGAVQIVTTTQPTVRTVASSWTPPVTFGVSTSTPGTNAAFIGVQQASVTGALPSNFTTSLSGSGSAPRIHARAA